MADPLVAANTPITVAGLSEEPETRAFDNGEHDLVIKVAKLVEKEETQKKDGSKLRSAGTAIQLVLEDKNSTDFDPIFELIYFPNGDDDVADKRKLKRVFYAAGVPIENDEVLPSDLVGKTVHVSTRSSISNGQTYVNVNWPKAV